jgi:hypothetical protein
MTNKIFHYVRHHEVEAYQKLGWVRHESLDATHHSQWSSLMEWKGEGDPVKPFFVSRETVSNRVPETNNNNESAHERPIDRA